MALADEEVDYELKITVFVFGFSFRKAFAFDILRNLLVEYDSACGRLYDTRMGGSIGQEYFTTNVDFVLTPELFGLISHQRFVYGSVYVGFVTVDNDSFGVFVARLRYRATYDYVFDDSYVSRVQTVFIRFGNDYLFFDFSSDGRYFMFFSS